MNKQVKRCLPESERNKKVGKAYERQHRPKTLTSARDVITFPDVDYL